MKKLFTLLSVLVMAGMVSPFSSIAAARSRILLAHGRIRRPRFALIWKLPETAD